MSSLEQFGIKPSHTTSPALAEERCGLGHAAYTERALRILQHASDFVVTELPGDLESFRSRWHPSGFMVYQLGTVVGLGMVRLHVWPNSERMISEKGDSVHDHAWHVASLVLRGSYSDTIYDLRREEVPSEEERIARGLLRVFDASYNPDASQVLTTDGTCVRILPVAQRIVRNQETHTIEPDVFHQPTLTSDQSVATLVLNSFRVHNNGPYVLIDGPPDAIPEVRQPLSEDDIAVTKQILAAKTFF